MSVNNQRANIKGRYMDERKGVYMGNLHQTKDPLAGVITLPSESK